MTEESKKRIRNTLFALGFVLVFAGPFYTAFVLQNLWNWFVADAIHAASISYVQSFGIMLAITVVRHRAGDDYDAKTRWTQLFSLLDHVVPEDALYRLKASFKEQENSLAATLSSVPDIGKAVLNTISLGIGFAIHTLLN